MREVRDPPIESPPQLVIFQQVYILNLIVHFL
jgi:hypothetical protein